MLRFSKTLLFPVLKAQRLVNLKGRDSVIRIYTLDWQQVDKTKEQRWKESGTTFPFLGTLPTDLINTIDNLLYAIPEHYLQQIRLFSMKAVVEFSDKGPDIFNPLFTPATPTALFVLNAFSILADCTYDQETGYFSRSNIRYILPCILSYRFWTFQIQPDKLERFSGLQELGIELQELRQTDPALEKELTYYYELLKNHTKELINLKNHTKEPVKKKNKEIKAILIKEASINDILNNRRTTASLNNITVNIPTIGEISFNKITLIKQNGITLFGEPNPVNTEKILNTYRQLPANFSISVNDESGSYTLRNGYIEELSGTPPLVIKMKFREIQQENSIPKITKENS